MTARRRPSRSILSFARGAAPPPVDQQHGGQRHRQPQQAAAGARRDIERERRQSPDGRHPEQDAGRRVGGAPPPESRGHDGRERRPASRSARRARCRCGSATNDWWVSSTTAQATLMTSASQAAAGGGPRRCASTPRNHSAPRIAYSVKCASLRTTPWMTSMCCGRQPRQKPGQERMQQAAGVVGAELRGGHRRGPPPSTRSAAARWRAGSRFHDTVAPMLGEILDDLLISASTGPMHHRHPSFPRARRPCWRRSPPRSTRASPRRCARAASSSSIATRRARGSCVEAGRNVVVVTPTASGKTLCYNLPALQSLVEQPEARVLYLFPTKALAQDQLAELEALAKSAARDADVHLRRRHAAGRAARRAGAREPRADQPRHAALGDPAAPHEVGDACSRTSATSSSTSCTPTAACSARTSPTCCGA